MPAQLPQARAKLAELKSKDDASTGYIDLLEEWLDLIAGASNELGTAATVDTGTEEGELALLGSGGRFGGARLPRDADFDSLTFDAPVDTQPTGFPDRAGVNVSHLERALVYALTPSSDLATGDTVVTAPSTAVPLTDAASSYRWWDVRYQRSGDATVRQVRLVNTFADGEWHDVDGALEYRQRAGRAGARALDFRASGQTGYRIFSVRGENTARVVPWAMLAGVPVFAARWPTYDEVTGRPVLWGRGYLSVVFTDTSARIRQLSVEEGRTAAFIDATGALGSTQAGARELRLREDGEWTVRNATNRVLDVVRFGFQPGDDAVSIPSGATWRVYRSGDGVFRAPPSVALGDTTGNLPAARVTGLPAAGLRYRRNGVTQTARFSSINYIP